MSMPQATNIHDVQLAYAVFAAQSAMHLEYHLLDEKGKIVKAAYRPLALFGEAIKGLSSEEATKKKETLISIFVSHYSNEKEFLEKLKNIVQRLAGAYDDETSQHFYAKGGFHKRLPFFRASNVLQDLIAAAYENESFEKLELPEEHKRSLKSAI
jgi:hypothetical protein